MAGSGDEGSILPLVAVFAGVAAALVITISAATSLAIERKRLYEAADGAALAAAESFGTGDVALIGDEVTPVLHPADVEAAAARWLAETQDPRRADVTLIGATTPDGVGVTVTVASRWRPPVLQDWLPVDVPLTATVTTRAVFLR